MKEQEGYSVHPFTLLVHIVSRQRPMPLDIDGARVLRKRRVELRFDCSPVETVLPPSHKTMNVPQRYSIVPFIVRFGGCGWESSMGELLGKAVKCRLGDGDGEGLFRGHSWCKSKLGCKMSSRSGRRRGERYVRTRSVYTPTLILAQHDEVCPWWKPFL